MKTINQLAFYIGDLNTIESSALPGFKFAGNGTAGTVGGVISALSPYIFALAGILLLLLLISSGFSYMTSRGDPKAMGAAQAKITYALVGFIIVFISYWLAQAAGLILGLNAVQNIFR